MIFRRPLLGLVLLGLIALFITACGGEEPTPTPTPAPPPTAVPTAVPPTAPPASQSSGATTPSSAQGSAILEAMNQVRNASAYRVNISLTGKGNFLTAGGAAPAPGQDNEPLTLVSMNGEVNAQNAHYTLQGAMLGMLGIEPSKTFEVITADGNAYLKGPVPLLGATEERWYQVPTQAAGIAEPPLTPSAILDSFSETGINFDDFTNAGTESLDGQNCRVYSGDKEVVVNAFARLGGAMGASQDDLDTIDNAEFKFWVCPDGYLHQVKMLMEGHEKDNPEMTGSFEIFLRISDFGADISIPAPADAIMLEFPSQPPAGPTPTP